MAGMSQAQEKAPDRLGPALEALSDVYKGLLRKSGAKIDVSVLERAASLYGSVRFMANLLGRQCEGQAERALTVAKEELSRVADLIGAEGKEADFRKLAARLAALEAIVHFVAAHCLEEN
jgi:hypothetical protein